MFTSKSALGIYMLLLGSLWSASGSAWGAEDQTFDPQKQPSGVSANIESAVPAPSPAERLEAQSIVPLLLGHSAEEGRAMVLLAGLRPRTQPADPPCPDPSLSNKIRRQYPPAGSLVAGGSSVTMVVCSPVFVSPEVTVPRVLRQDLNQAKDALLAAGLRYRTKERRDCADPFLQGKVIAQNPEPQSLAKRGHRVVLTYCALP